MIGIVEGRRWCAGIAILAAALVAIALPAGARATAITEHSAGLPTGVDFSGLTAGSNGNLWFTNNGTTPSIGRFTLSGTVTNFTGTLGGHGKPSDLTLGPDGNVWFTEEGSANNAIGRITPAGVITEFTVGLNPMSDPNNLTVGPDGNPLVP